MLNRIYIILGLLAISLLIGAFLAPFMINWDNYRDRMEYIAQKALGKQVSIEGDLSLSLLPFPKLSFEDVIVGSTETSVAKIAKVSAQFTLFDFLRNHYKITNLTIQSPSLFLQIDKKGELLPILNLPKTIVNSNISIAAAYIENGSIELLDNRNNEILLVDAFNGKLALDGLQGPFSLEGSANYNDKKYNIIINSSKLNEQREMQLSAVLRSDINSFSLKIDGALKADNLANFTGTTQLRIFAPKISNQEELDNQLGVRGDLLFNSEVSASLKEVLFKDYTIVLDENRPVSRLSGAANIDLQNNREFNAVISGSILTLGMQNYLEENEEGSYSILSFLNDLPLPFIPKLSGNIGIDILDLDVGEFSLKNVRIDAQSDGENWLVDNFSAQIKGKSDISLSGKLSRSNNRANFAGTINIDSKQLGQLSQILKRSSDKVISPNINASINSEILLKDQQLLLNGGSFIVDNIRNDFSFLLDFGAQPSLDFKVDLGEYNKNASELLLSLFPKIGSGTKFNNSFKNGSFNISVNSLYLFDLKADQLGAIGSWNENIINMSSLIFGDFAGASFDVSGAYNYTNPKPIIWGDGQISLLSNAQSGALEKLFERVKAPPFISEYLFKSLPAEFNFELSEPKNLEQLFSLNGTAGAADVVFSLLLDEGAFNIMNAPLNGKMKLSSNKIEQFVEQLGLEEDMLSTAKQLELSLKIDGTIMNSIGIDLLISGGQENANFAGNLIVSDPNNWRGKGKLEIAVDDISPILLQLGTSSVSYSPFIGSADISFTHDKNITLSSINGMINNTQISGELERNIDVNGMSFSGELELAELDISVLPILLGGSASMIMGDGIWAEGPFEINVNSTISSGNILLQTPIIKRNEEVLATNNSFNYIFNKNKNIIRDFKAEVGNGNIGFDLEICCNSALSEKQLSARITIENIAIKNIFPDEISNNINGLLSGSMQFLGSGNTYANIIDSLSGDGSVIIDNLILKQLNPDIFNSISLHENILDLDEKLLEDIIRLELFDKQFASESISALVLLASGTMRMSNIAIQSKTAKLFGSLNIALQDLSIKGKWVLSPLPSANISDLIDITNALLDINISGTLSEPKLEFDMRQLIDGIKVKALEMEVDRLEKLRLEAEERSRQAALARAKLIEEQARLLAERQRIEAEELALHEAQKMEAEALDNPDNNAEIIEPPIDLLNDDFNVPPASF